MKVDYDIVNDEDGRVLSLWGLSEVVTSLQDDGRTLKVFVRG